MASPRRKAKNFENWFYPMAEEGFSFFQCATGNPVPVDPATFFQIRSGSGQILTGLTGFCLNPERNVF